MKWLYPVILWLALPLVWVRLQLRARKEPAYGIRQKERFGRVAVSTGPIWFHTVSAGETIAAVPLIQRLVQDNPESRFLVTTMTPTGSQQVTDKLAGLVEHCYAPYDFKFAVKRFYDTARPRMLVLMETELWPNLIGEASWRGIPVLVVNARLSEKSARGYRRGGSLIRRMLSQVDYIACQTEIHRERFLELGVERDKISAAGSVKFDITPPDHWEASRDTLRARLGLHGQPVWIAASTHPGEDEVVIDAFVKVRAENTTLRLLLVPRHPARADDVGEMVQAAGLEPAFQSKADKLKSDPSIVVIGDVMGDLLKLYSLADVAFVGGSLVPTGGHNPIEPAIFNVPVISGPERFNFEDVFDQLEAEGGVVSIHDEDSLANGVLRLLTDVDYRQGVGDAGRRVVEANRGASERIRGVLQDRIDQLP